MSRLKRIFFEVPRRTNLKRSDYLDHNDYARAMLRSGGPDLDDIGHIGGGSRLYSQILTSVWGASLAEFNAMCGSELDEKQRRQSHIFVRKYSPPGRHRRR
jgi:hypothetical protein